MQPVSSMCAAIEDNFTITGFKSVSSASSFRNLTFNCTYITIHIIEQYTWDKPPYVSANRAAGDNVDEAAVMAYACPLSATDIASDEADIAINVCSLSSLFSLDLKFKINVSHHYCHYLLNMSSHIVSI